MLSLSDIEARLRGEPSPASDWSGTPRFACGDGCPVWLSSLPAISEHRERCIVRLVRSCGPFVGVPSVCVDCWTVMDGVQHGPYCSD